MWRQIGKLISKILAIILPVVLVMQIFCAAFPMSYMDVEYAMYKQQKDYISKNHDTNRVLILGDSRAKASFMPDVLGEDVYNISLGGGSLGLLETILPDYYAISNYVLPIERDFCGTFMGDIKSFKMYGGFVNYSAIANYLS